MKTNLRLSRRAFVAGSIAVLAAPLAGEAQAVARPTTDWTAIAAFVSAGATLVLVIITAIYVWLTHRLVRAQERPLIAIRLAAQESAARSLAATLRSVRHLVVRGARFPLDLTAKPSASSFVGPEWQTLAFALNAAAPQLSQPLFGLCLTAALAVTDADLTRLALIMVITAEESAAARENRAWSWDQARTTYLSEVRERLLDTRPEWEEIVAGRAIADAERALKELNDHLTRYLLGDPAR